MERDRKQAGCARRTVVAGGLGLAGAALARPVFAAPVAFPSRPLSLLVPGSPGGGYDQVARLMQYVIRDGKLSPVPIEVVNRGGAGGTIGVAELLSRHTGDPNTVMVAGAYLVATAIANASPVSLADTVPIARMMSDYLVVGVPASSPFQNIHDLLKAFAADPDSMSWCGGSAGGTDHMLVGIMAQAAGISPRRLRYVAYAGGGEASAALLGGQVRAGVNGYSEWVGLRDDKRIRFLASSSPQRIDAITPTFRDQGYDITLENWRGVFAAPGLSTEELNWWKGLTRAIRDNPKWKEYSKRNTWTDTYLEGAPFGTFLASEEQRVGKILAQLGIGSAGDGGGYPGLGPWAFPAAIGAVGTAAAAGVLLEHRIARRADAAAAGAPVGPAASSVIPDPAEAPAIAEAPPSWKRFAAGLGLAITYLVAMQFIGFLIATPLFLFGVCRLVGSRAWIRDGVVSILLSIAVWALFTRVLQVILP